MATVSEHLKQTGYLVLGSRAHLLRPDGNRTVCGRYSFATISERRLTADVVHYAAQRPCEVCRDPSNATAAERQARRTTAGAG